jgi:hypothetical protein
VNWLGISGLKLWILVNQLFDFLTFNIDLVAIYGAGKLGNNQLVYRLAWLR